MTEQSFDVIVIGTGSGGKIAAQQLARAGRSVAAIEAGRFGGECPYVACVPAKSILASAHGGLDWDETIRRRDELTDHRDDTGSQESLTEVGVTTLRGRARLDGIGDGRHRVTVTTGDGGEEQTLTAEAVVIGTGSSPVHPPVDGLDEVDPWTSDVALSTDERPASLAVLGGGAVGCELAQAYALLGVRVELIEIADRLVATEQPWVGDALAEQLRADGVIVHVGTSAERARRVGEEIEISTDTDTVVRVARVLVAGGRRPNTDDLGLDRVGVEPGEADEIVIDEHGRVVGAGGSPVAGLYAVGDVTAVSSYTHSANDQAEVVAAVILGQDRRTDYRAVPRVIYTEPAVYCVGATAEQAQQDGVSLRTVRFDVSEVEKAALLETSSSLDPVTVRGGVELIIDTDADVVIGAACMGPQADAWGAELTLAVHARLSPAVLAGCPRAFPTWSEAVGGAVEQL